MLPTRIRTDPVMSAIQGDADDIVLQVNKLKTYYHPGRQSELRAVDDVSFALRRGSTLCIVGESGSGKSVTARSILQLVQPSGRIVSGSVLYRGRAGEPSVDLAKLPPRGRAIRAIRGRGIAMVFQEPMTSLSPIHRVGRQIAEAMTAHGGQPKRSRATRRPKVPRYSP